VLQGVLAIGLTREEEHVERRRRRAAGGTMLQTYQVLPQIGPVRVTVIQASDDNYLPAAEARRLFGPETPTRRFVEIPRTDHNFDGARSQLYTELGRSLDWITGGATEPMSGRRGTAPGARAAGR
jgi:hypothetical protein